MPERSRSEDKPSTSFIAVIASFVVAGLLGAGGFFLGWGLIDAGQQFHGAGMRASRGLGPAMLLALLLAAGALAFAWIGVRCLVDGAKNTGRSKQQAKDEQDYWNSFPAPKD